MNKLPDTSKDTSATDQEFPVPGNGGHPCSVEEVTPQPGDHSNLADAINDDKENQVSQTLIDAAKKTDSKEPAITVPTHVAPKWYFGF